VRGDRAHRSAGAGMRPRDRRRGTRGAGWGRTWTPRTHAPRSLLAAAVRSPPCPPHPAGRPLVPSVYSESEVRVPTREHTALEDWRPTRNSFSNAHESPGGCSRRRARAEAGQRTRTGARIRTRRRARAAVALAPPAAPRPRAGTKCKPLLLPPAVLTPLTPFAPAASRHVPPLRCPRPRGLRVCLHHRRLCPRAAPRSGPRVASGRPACAAASASSLRQPPGTGRANSAGCSAPDDASARCDCRAQRRRSLRADAVAPLLTEARVLRGDPRTRNGAPHACLLAAVPASPCITDARTTHTRTHFLGSSVRSRSNAAACRCRARSPPWAPTSSSLWTRRAARSRSRTPAS